MTVSVAVLVRNELNVSALYRLEGILCKGLHLEEPLHRKPWLDNGICPLGITDRRSIILHLLKISCLFKHLHDLLAGIEPVLAHEDLSLLVETAVVIDDIKYRKVVPHSYLIVIDIMSRSHLEAACSEIHGHIAVFYDRYLLVDERDKNLLSLKVMITLILRIDTDGSIGHDGLRTGCRDDYVLVGRIAVSVRDEVSQMVELADGILMNHLLVAHCRKTYRIPVDHTDTSVYISLIIEVYESVDHSLAQFRIHRELGPVPVA